MGNISCWHNAFFGRTCEKRRRFQLIHQMARNCVVAGIFLVMWRNFFYSLVSHEEVAYLSGQKGQSSSRFQWQMLHQVTFMSFAPVAPHSVLPLTTSPKLECTTTVVKPGPYTRLFQVRHAGWLTSCFRLGAPGSASATMDREAAHHF